MNNIRIGTTTYRINLKFLNIRPTMEHINGDGYKFLSDKIVEKYGIGNQILLYEPDNFILISKAFNQELSLSALLWLGTMLGQEPQIQEYLVEQVNLINKKQRERFTHHCRAIGSILSPYNSINLN